MSGLKGLGGALEIGEGQAGSIYMRQHWSMLEAATGGLFERSNVYDVYKSNSYEDKDKLLKIQARSTNCERQCFAPMHSVMLHISDLNGNTFVTIQRKGVCSDFPMKCCIGQCCALTDCCQDGIIIHEGKVTAEPACCNLGCCCCDGFGHGTLHNANPISKAQVPMCGGGCYPTIDIFEDYNSTSPNGRMKGPMCFGGCSELCCESDFSYKTNDGRAVGRARKLVPNTCGQVCQELCTDSDRYMISFAEGSSGEEKANTIGLALLADYMYFERDQGMITCTFEGGKPALKCTCCLMSCCGEVIPCTCICKADGSSGGGSSVGPGGPECQTMER